MIENPLNNSLTQGDLRQDLREIIESVCAVSEVTLEALSRVEMTLSEVLENEVLEVMKTSDIFMPAEEDSCSQMSDCALDASMTDPDYHSHDPEAESGEEYDFWGLKETWACNVTFSTLTEFQEDNNATLEEFKGRDSPISWDQPVSCGDRNDKENFRQPKMCGRIHSKPC